MRISCIIFCSYIRLISRYITNTVCNFLLLFFSLNLFLIPLPRSLFVFLFALSLTQSLQLENEWSEKLNCMHLQFLLYADCGRLNKSLIVCMQICVYFLAHKYKYMHEMSKKKKKEKKHKNIFFSLIKSHTLLCIYCFYRMEFSIEYSWKLNQSINVGKGSIELNGVLLFVHN